LFDGGRSLSAGACGAAGDPSGAGEGSGSVAVGPSGSSAPAGHAIKRKAGSPAAGGLKRPPHVEASSLSRMQGPGLNVTCEESATYREISSSGDSTTLQVEANSTSHSALDFAPTHAGQAPN